MKENKTKMKENERKQNKEKQVEYVGQRCGVRDVVLCSLCV